MMQIIVHMNIDVSKQMCGQDHVKSIEKTLVDIQTESTYLWTLGCTIHCFFLEFRHAAWGH